MRKVFNWFNPKFVALSAARISARLALAFLSNAASSFLQAVTNKKDYSNRSSRISHILFKMAMPNQSCHVFFPSPSFVLCLALLLLWHPNAVAELNSGKPTLLVRPTCCLSGADDYSSCCKAFLTSKVPSQVLRFVVNVQPRQSCFSRHFRICSW